MTASGGISARLARHAPAILGVLGCVLLTAAVAAAAWFSYRQHDRAEHALQLRHAMDTALVLEVHARDTLASVDDAVRGIKRGYERDGLRTDLRRLLDDYRDIAGYIAVASVADEQGRLILSTLPIPPGAAIADLEHFRVHVARDTGEPYINKPLLGRVSGKWSFHVTRRINRADGSFGGVAIVAVDFSYWDRLLQDGSLGNTGAIVLVGRDGVARATHERAGAVDGLMRADWGFLLRPVEAGNPRGLAVADGHAGAVAGTWAYRSLDDYPLVVAVSIDEQDLQQRMGAIRAGYAAGVLVVAILAGLFAAGLLVLFGRQRVHAAAVRESEGRFRAMFDHAGVGITLRSAHDRHQPWIAVNDRFCEMTGYSRDELLRMSTADITPPEFQDDAVRGNTRLLGGDVGSYAREKRILCKDGRQLWVTLSVVALPDEQGRPHRLIATYQDINARKQAEERLRESEGRLRAIIAAEPECVAIIAPDGRLLDMNPAGLRMLQADSIEEMRRWPFFRQVVPQYRRAFVRLQHRVLSGESGVLEFEAVGLAGKRCWLEIHAAPLHDASGAITAALGIARDVTERRTVREALAAERSLLRTVIDSLPDRIRVKGLDLRYTLANEAWRRVRVPGGRDVIGLTNYDLMPYEQAARFEEEDLAVIATGQFSRPREVIDGPPDDQHWFVTTKMPLRDAAGNVIGIVGISRDVTDFKLRSLEVEKLNAALETRVAERTAQLTTANEELESFAYSVSHDLRAPLRHIDGLAAVLLEDHAESLDTAGRNYLARIRAAALRMAGLIEDLLRLSRVTQAELNIADADLSAMARAIADELRRDDPARKVTFRIKPLLRVQADSGLLWLALTNLIHNAWKFTGNKPAATIEVGATQREGVTAYFVRDDGAGFDMAHAGQLFEAFRRLHTEQEFPGTGIGLAIVRRVMRRHGGDAWAESATGQGATFYFSLRGRAAAGNGRNPGLSEARAPVPVTAPAANAAGMARHTVLLVDDDPDVLVLTARALALDDYQVLTAGCGEDALSLLREHAASVVVSDFSMPGMNGAQLLAQVGALYPDTLRIIVSGQTMNRAMQAGLRRGEIHHYFEKQLSYDAVRGCIRDWLTAARQQK